MPPVGLAQDRVEVPVPPPIVAGLSEQLRFVEFVTAETVTVPAKPLTGETVIVDGPETIALMETDVGFDASVKSWTVKVTAVECERPALVPIIVTWIVEVDEKLHDRVAPPEPTKLDGAIVHAVLFVVKVTVAEKPFIGVTLTVEPPDAPTSTLTLVGVAEIAKSWTL